MADFKIYLIQFALGFLCGGQQRWETVSHNLPKPVWNDFIIIVPQPVFRAPVCRAKVRLA
jgi:hypothetical protein